MPVLKGLSLHISPGETVALVGRSGCGKSTLLSLITRLHDPTRGSILLDGIEIKGLDQDSLRGNIGMVTQMPYLFNMSIRDNFAIVKKDVTDEEIVAACKTACIHDDIMNFSEGYDTVIGEGGILISGGQRQRIIPSFSWMKPLPPWTMKPRPKFRKPLKACTEKRSS